MKLALYRAQHGNWLDTSINLLSGGGGFSHVELVFGWPHSGVCFSSTSRDGDGGTRFKQIDLDPLKWVEVEVGSLPNQESKAFETAQGLLGHGYDFKGVFRLIPLLGHFFKENKTKYFCSEVVLEVLHSAGLLTNLTPPYRYSPNDIAKALGVKSS